MNKVREFKYTYKFQQFYRKSKDSIMDKMLSKLDLRRNLRRRFLEWNRDDRKLADENLLMKDWETYDFSIQSDEALNAQELIGIMKVYGEQKRSWNKHQTNKIIKQQGNYSFREISFGNDFVRIFFCGRFANDDAVFFVEKRNGKPVLKQNQKKEMRVDKNFVCMEHHTSDEEQIASWFDAKSWDWTFNDKTPSKEEHENDWKGHCGFWTRENKNWKPTPERRKQFDEEQEELNRWTPD
jgi:hypothetical protein